MLEISVLGPVEVTLDGKPLQVPGGKTAEVLVRLAVEAGAVVHADRLVEDLWAEDAVHTSRNTLQAKVARLRRALTDPTVIESADGGYRLAADPGTIDALAVVSDSAAAADLLDAGDDRGAAELSAAALSRFRGGLLGGAGAGDWAAPYRARLEDTRMQLVETELAARLQLGGGGELTARFEAAVAAYPFREVLWELLMTGLYRAGRQADALVAYQRARTVLADELGLAPGPRLRELERRILDQDPGLPIGDRSTRALDVHSQAGNLPSLATELVGRAADSAAVSDLLAGHRLVTIVGAGGIGKTALALAVGRELAAPGGVWLVRLESAATFDEVLDAVIAALHVSGDQAVLLERLRAAPAVVILDNCEHVLDAAAALAVQLLDGAPQLRVLCTSQAPLQVDGEAVLELAPLDLPEAVELFGRRAAVRDQESTTTDALLELCRSLDGLPLAIELAAARARTLPVAEISRRLEDRFSLLSDPTSRRPERRRALRATIGWSYDLLFPDDQRGLWALATFAGGAPLPAAEAVLDALEVPRSAAMDVVGRLSGRSLVMVDQEEGSVRYRLLDSIRAFALEAMTSAEVLDHARAAHARWFAAAAAASTAGVRSARQAEHLAFARSERANIDAALTWAANADPQLALVIARGFAWAWIVLGDSRGAQRILDSLDAAGDTVAAVDRADALLAAAWIEASTDRLSVARDHMGAAAAIADATGDVELQARCRYHLAYVVSHHGEFAHAIELTARASELFGELDRPWDQATNWLFAARAAISAGDLERAAHARDQVDRWLRDVDDPWLHVRREAMLGELARVEHRFGDAVVHLQRAAERSGRSGFRQTEAYQLSSLGRAQCQDGDYAAGARTLQLAIEKAEAIGDTRLAALARVHLGRVLRALGRTEEARVALEAAARWHRAAGGGEQAALGDTLLAAMDGDRARLEDLLAVARGDGDALAAVFALDALGGGSEEADRWMAQAAHFITARDRVDRIAGEPPRTPAGRP